MVLSNMSKGFWSQRLEVQKLLSLESPKGKQTGITSKKHRGHFTIGAMISKDSSNNIDQGSACCFGSSVISFSHP